MAITKPAVAPLAGAWIETFFRLTRTVSPVRSRPSRARGLKRNASRHLHTRSGVAPLAGAWIETPAAPAPSRHPPVAPLAGAWIETAR